MLEKLHTILYTEVGEAVRPHAHVEKNWSESEMVKRIVRYIYNQAGKEEVLTLPWEEGVKKFVSSAMQSYAASCQEKDWFYDVDLVPVFQRAAWEVLTASKNSQGMDYRIVEEIAELECQSYVDETLSNKAMWVAVTTPPVSQIVPDVKRQGKIFASLQRTFTPALDLALSDTRPLEDLQRLEIFLKKWMEDSLARMWNCVGEPGQNLTEELANQLFRKLMAPFGTRHAYSCVPQVLTENIGRPPDKWHYIPETIRGIFRSWTSQQSAGAAKKRRKADADGEDYMVVLPPEDTSIKNRRGSRVEPKEEEEEEELQYDPEEPEAVEAELEPEDGEAETFDEPLPGEGEMIGHPRCTSQEDCQGSEDDPLIRHILNGKPGDVYCRVCWTSFLDQNPTLEGDEEE